MVSVLFKPFNKRHSHFRCQLHFGGVKAVGLVWGAREDLSVWCCHLKALITINNTHVNVTNTTQPNSLE